MTGFLSDASGSTLGGQDGAHPGRRGVAMKGRRQAEFDPVLVGQRECAAWAAYYRHEWRSFLRSAVGMVDAGFGMSRRRTLAAAWHVLQANRAWAPYPDNDPHAARAHMRRFYEIVRDSGWGKLDPATAAELEVEWWRVHRNHQRGADGEEQLCAALDALYAHVYEVPAGTMREAARLRAQAMEHSDAWVQRGRRLDDPELAAERRALVASYAALRESVERNAAAR
jgi:hypothetical protein